MRVVNNNNSYIDLQPGWRLRVVTPLLKESKLEASNSGARKADFPIPGLRGYEVDYYLVQATSSAGVRVKFDRGEANADGETTATTRPAARLFEIPRSVKYIRLLYLERSSQLDHDMAVLGSNRPDRLDQLTRAVESQPDVCAAAGSNLCLWVPARVAVIPELKKAGKKGVQWAPVR